MKNLFLFVLVCTSNLIIAQNQAPQITNLNLMLTGSDLLTIRYDLFDFEDDDITISLYVKKSDGLTYNINTQNATGDLNLVSQGTGKIIEWNFADELSSSAEYVIKLVAEDTGMINIQSIVDQVDSNKLKSDLELIEGVRHRSAGADQLQTTRDFIEQRLTGFGLNSSVQDFNFGSYTGKNYIGTKPGTTEDATIYICDGHYDTVAGSPGADDNGSGVVGFLEAARILSNYNFKKTIKFIGFDLEEAGLKGSLAYVADHLSDEEEIAGVLNFEMIGYATEEPNSQTLPSGFNFLFPDAYATLVANSFKGNFIGNFGLVNQSDWALAYDSAAAKYVPDLKVITFLAPQNWASIAPDLGRSDHAPFWLTNNPAVMLTGTANFRNPNYHFASDTIGTLNFTFMSNVVKAAVATLAEAAEIHNSSYVEESINIAVSSINEAPSFDFFVLPNPVNDILRFNSSNLPTQLSVVEIYNMKGQLIIEKEISKVDKSFSLEVGEWPNGVYLLKTKTGEITKRFVIQH